MTARLVTFVVVLCLLGATSCTKNGANRPLHEGVTVCGTLVDENQQPVTSTFVELHESAKDLGSRYQVGRVDASGQFMVQTVKPGHYWLGIAGKGKCTTDSRDEREARRIPVTVPDVPSGTECQTQWQVVQDASCKLRVSAN